MVKILSGDPGKIRDSFFRVGTEIKEGKIYVRLAKQRLGKSYLAVCEEFAEDSRKYNFDYNIIEYNNTGVAVVEMLTEEFGLPVIPITTINLGRDIKRKVSPKSMDKYEIVHWAINAQEQGLIVFPGKGSKDMEELKRQWQIFAEHRTDAGNVAYYAPGQEHDDGVMALLLNLHLARNFLSGDRKQNTIQTASRKSVNSDNDDFDDDDALPKNAKMLQSHTFMPSG